MGSKHRDETAIVVDILKAASNRCGITQIMFLANLSYALAKKYFKIAMNAGLLSFNDPIYEVTESGQTYVQKYDDFCQRYSAVLESLYTLSVERETLKLSSQNGTENKSLENRRKVDTLLKDENLKVSCTLQRFNAETFYNELQTLGFNPEAASEIVSWIDIINARQPAFFSGRKTVSIKSCLAYIGAKLFRTTKTVTEQKISLFYGVLPADIQRYHKKYLKILFKEEPAFPKLKKTFLKGPPRKQTRMEISKNA